MNLRSRWLAVPGFICIAALATMLSAYSGASSSEGNSPVQPVAYRHTVHVDTLKMNCLYCHFSANKSFDPGLPAVGTCMGCHTVVTGSSPGNKAEIQKLTAYWNKKEPVPWIRIHKLPEYVHFPHMRHVNAGVTCQTCHGEIQNMKQVYQASSLNMGWCINCHIGQSNPPFRARYDCSSCHY
jgi:c(7)-type cytochrome triheme protein